MTVPKPSDLTREKSLLALWLTSFKFSQKKFNYVVTAVVSVLLGVYCLLGVDQPQNLMIAFRKLQATGLSFATSILGFLVAGFTVFVTVTRIDMFLQMAKAEKGETGESYLKYNLSAFIVTFVHYTSYIFFCIFSELFLQPGGLGTIALVSAIGSPFFAQWVPYVHKAVAIILVFGFGTWTAYLVLLLKSFIYNIYQVTTTSVRFSWENPSPAADIACGNSDVGNLPSQEIGTPSVSAASTANPIP